MRAVTKNWLTFAILATLSGACGDGGGSNDGETNGGATAGTNTGDSAGTNGSGTNGSGSNTNGSGSNGTNNTSNTGSTAGDGGNTGTSAGDGGNTGNGLPAASECGALDDGSGKSLDTSAMGGCYYFYCYTTEAELLSSATPGGACSSPSDVATQCEGTSVNVVSECARANVLQAANETNFTKAITDCAKPKLPGFSEGCLACNVQSAVCAGKLANCLAPCRDKDTPACDKCRQDKGCTPAFYDCAGLPDPMM